MLEVGDRIEVLTIGDELLDGRVLDTNTVRLAGALAQVGLRIAQRSSITDDVDVIVREARAVAARGTRLCIVSGGLGPTSDDLTSEAFAGLLGVELVRDEEQVRRIEQRLQRRGRPVTDNQRKQADRPRGSEVLVNSAGTAPGFAVTYGGCRFVVVPGVPIEFDAMIEQAVVAPLRAALPPLERRSFYTFGLLEAEVDARLTALARRWPTVRVGYRAHFPEIHVSLVTPHAERAAIDEAAAFVREQLAEHVFSERGEALAAVVLEAMRVRGATLAIAESCTGGLIGDMLTDVPGSSDVLVLDVVSYADSAKEAVLGVRPETLREHGAVSEATVLEMAAGARARVGTSHGIAVSGIAGPGGGTPDKPVGTVCLAVVGPTRSTSRRLQFPFDRRRNKVVSAYAALDLLRRHLE